MVIEVAALMLALAVAAAWNGIAATLTEIAVDENGMAKWIETKAGIDRPAGKGIAIGTAAGKAAGIVMLADGIAIVTAVGVIMGGETGGMAARAGVAVTLTAAAATGMGGTGHTALAIAGAGIVIGTAGSGSVTDLARRTS